MQPPTPPNPKRDPRNVIKPPLYLSLPDAPPKWRQAVAQAFSSHGHATLSRDDRDPALPWPTELRRLMAQANTLVTLLTPAGHDHWQLREQALWSSANHQADSVLVLPPDSDLPAALAYPRPWATLKDPDALDGLAAAVEQALAARPSTTDTASQCPYPGLRPFQPAEAALLFGRHQPLQSLQAQLQHQPLVVISAAAGIGKRSLIQAGLFPAMQRADGHTASGGPWECLTVIPGAAPFHALAAALTQRIQPDADSDQQQTAADDLGNQLQTGSLDLAPVISQLLRVQNGSKGVLLHLQQLETLVSPQPHSDADAFLQLLLSAAAQQPLKLVASLDSRYQTLMLRHLPSLSQDATWMPLAPLQGADLREAICAPAKLAGTEVEPRMLEQLLSDADQTSGHPAMLACALQGSWLRRSGSRLDAAAYHASGGLQHCLSQRAEQAWRKLGSEQQHQLEQHWCEQFAAHQHSLSDPAGDNPALHWQRSRHWQAQQLAFQGWHSGIHDAAVDWQQDRRAAAKLLHGPEQKEAEAWLMRRGQQLSETEREFIRAGLREKSHKAGLRRARRRQIGLAIALGISVTALGISASQWWLATRISHDPTPRQSSTDSPGLPGYATNPAASNTAAAIPAPPSTGSEPFNTTPKLLTVPGDRVNDLAFSSDGRFLLTASSSGSINLWEVAGDESRQQLDAGERPISAIHFFDRQRQFASVSIDTAILRWKLPGRRPQQLQPGNRERVTATAFSGSGNRLLIADSGRRLDLYDLLAGKHLTRLKGHLAEVIAIAVSADDSRIVSADEAGDIWLWNGIELNAEQHQRGHRNYIDQLQFDPQGERFLSAGGDGHIRLWSSKDAAPLLDILATDGRLHAVRFSPSGATIASTAEDGTITLWDSHSGQQTGTLQGHHNTVRSLSFSPDGRWLASAGDDRSVRLWPLAGGDAIVLRRNHSTRLTNLKFDPTGHWLAATGGNANLLLWAIPNGQPAPDADMAAR